MLKRLETIQEYGCDNESLKKRFRMSFKDRTIYRKTTITEWKSDISDDPSENTTHTGIYFIYDHGFCYEFRSTTASKLKELLDDEQYSDISVMELLSWIEL